MSDLSGLLADIKEYNKKFEITENSTKAEKLRHRITSGVKTDEEWLEIQKEVKEYIKTGPSREEIEILNSCCEMVNMTCSAIREKSTVK